ncbi:MAG: cellulase family glycosylhydrolase, partial [bacterium]
EMKELGANVVRVHLQIGKFMLTPETPNSDALVQLRRLVSLAEESRLYLDITGLGCYHKSDVPEWYDALSEGDRWGVQARFWEAVADTCASSAAIFCYDLMNEPVVAGSARADGDWLGPPFAGKHFVQFITLDPAGRPRPQIARAWIRRLAAAIRKHDRDHLITVGLVPWSLDRPGLSSGFVPGEIAPELDFISVHLYPQSGALSADLGTLREFSVGKPVLVEEIFPLHCSAAELAQFIEASRPFSSGWIGFYWGKTPAELSRSTTIPDHLMLAWLNLFQRLKPTVQ